MANSKAKTPSGSTSKLRGHAPKASSAEPKQTRAAILARHQGVEWDRLKEDEQRKTNWKRWGPYLAERQWGTVREDYSADGSVWSYFTHDQARSRTYRWGEDGLLGICDRECRLCFALSMWNGQDPILKERLFGLTGPEGNHGEDVKELYYYLDSTPTHSYMKALYKYPQSPFPYDQLVQENRRRGKDADEYELIDTGVFDDDRYFDVMVEYAKGGADDLLIRVTVTNRGKNAATLHLLPTLWFRNGWTWGHMEDGRPGRPVMKRSAKGKVRAEHETLGVFEWRAEADPDSDQPRLLFTENETNFKKLWGVGNEDQYVKDAFHRRVIEGEQEAVNPDGEGTKAAAWYQLQIDPGQSQTIRLRLTAEQEHVDKAFGDTFEQVMSQRIKEADAFYDSVIPQKIDDDERLVMRQAYAGLLWSKQFYYYVVNDWLHGDPNMPDPPMGHKKGRNQDWDHMYCRDVISMPDTWEYPWFAAWDLAFHMLPMAQIDPSYSKLMLTRLLREWYMHPSGQLPAYEFAFSDVNPPVHAYACWRVYKQTAPRGQRDRAFLSSAFQKLLMNFTWWVNRKDPKGRHVFSGGFLGLDNIGVFDRSQPLPGGQTLTQSDGTAWMAFYCSTMLSIALELAEGDRAYEDMASKFFEHFVAIVDAMNTLGGTGLWDDKDGFYYDQLRVDGQSKPIRVRSLVGLMPLLAVQVIERSRLDNLGGFRKRMDWFLKHRADLAEHISWMDCGNEDKHYLLAIPSKERLIRVLGYMLDPKEFLSPFGIRSLSKVYEKTPYVLDLDGQHHSVAYEPGVSRSGMFGGNSNWRGPVWFPVNFVLIESLRRYHYYYGDGLKVECPTGSGQMMTLEQVAGELEGRLASLFTKDQRGHRPCHGGESPVGDRAGFKGLVLFHEYFHAETGSGLGASHQTGWTSLITRCFEKLAQQR